MLLIPPESRDGTLGNRCAQWSREFRPVEPIVSVIIPCFNQGRYLEESVSSILRQTYGQWECIIVNDGSLDSTAKIAMRLSRQDPRIRYVEKLNGGLSSARNCGLSHARGHYIQFLDADDIVTERKLESQISAFCASPDASLCISNFRWASGEHAANFHTESPLNRPRLRSNPALTELISRWEIDLAIPIHCFLFERALFECPTVRFDESLPGHEDWDCWLRLFCQPIGIVYVDEFQAIYRACEGSMSRDPITMWRNFLLVCEKQRMLHKDDPLIARAFAEKIDVMRKVYRNRSIKFRLNRWFPTLSSVYKHLRG